MGFTLPASNLVNTGVERATLVRRTYTLVFFSILVTMVGATYALGNAALMDSVKQHPILSALCTFVPLFGAQWAGSRFPLNVAMVLLFTFAMGVYMAPALALANQYQPGVITQAAILTVGAFGTLTLYAFVSRRDFSAWGSFLTVGLLVLIGTSLLNLFFHNTTATLWLAAVTILLFSGLLIYDTWRLRNIYGPDDYVAAALNIYLDLLNMFMAILTLLGGDRRRN
jgi:FtsH-binding integral membrane protein